MDPYWEVEFPDTKMQVSGNWSKQQATDAIKQAMIDYIEKHIKRVEPAPDIEGVEVVFGELEEEEDAEMPKM